MNLMTTPKAAEYISMSEDFLKRARMTGKGPAFIKIGRKVLYRLDALDIFLEKNTRQNNSVVKI